MLGDARKGLKEQEEILLEYLNEEKKNRYLELKKSENLGKDGDVEFELAEIMRDARGKHHDVNYPRSPLCQWSLEMLSVPMNYWLEKAANLGHKEAFFDHLIQIESKENWEKVRDGYKKLIDEHRHMESLERLAFLYTDEGAMNKPQVVPEIDYNKANELLLDGIKWGASWLVRSIYYNFEKQIRAGKTTFDKWYEYKDSIEKYLDHTPIEIGKEYKKVLKPILKKEKIKFVDLTNIGEVCQRLKFGDFSRLIYPSKPTKEDALKNELLKYLEGIKEKKIREIER